MNYGGADYVLLVSMLLCCLTGVWLCHEAKRVGSKCRLKLRKRLAVCSNGKKCTQLAKSGFLLVGLVSVPRSLRRSSVSVTRGSRR